jgi:antitoxin ParD1/3/4
MPGGLGGFGRAVMFRGLWGLIIRAGAAAELSVPQPVCFQYSLRYALGMTKIAVSLPDEQVAAIKRAVASGRARTVSSFISEAVERAQKEDSLAAVLADLDRELGEPSEQAQAWAQSELRRIGLLK